MPLAGLNLKGDSVFILGGNGMGKTSLLEAMGLVSALRSFRTSDTNSMIRHGEKEARILCQVEQEREGGVGIEISLRKGGKAVRLEGSSLPRLSALVGRFPTVTLGSQDILLIRGSPSLRRRFIDMMLAEADPGALEAMRRYGHAFKGRSSLLHSGRPDELAAFEIPMAEAAAVIVEARQRAFQELEPLLAEAYAGIAPITEKPYLTYRPNVAGNTSDDFARCFAATRERDILRGMTSRGPHLDDFTMGLGGKPAKEYTSEGQQRGLVLALRLAQARWLRQRTGLDAVLFADDILGELDPARRAAFWASLGDGTQLVATGTIPPPDDALGGSLRLVRIEEIIETETPVEPEKTDEGAKP